MSDPVPLSAFEFIEEGLVLLQKITQAEDSSVRQMYEQQLARLIQAHAEAKR